jgi:hypothetical protein
MPFLADMGILLRLLERSDPQRALVRLGDGRKMEFRGGRSPTEFGNEEYGGTRDKRRELSLRGLYCGGRSHGGRKGPRA